MDEYDPTRCETIGPPAFPLLPESELQEVPPTPPPLPREALEESVSGKMRVVLIGLLAGIAVGSISMAIAQMFQP